MRNALDPEIEDVSCSTKSDLSEITLNFLWLGALRHVSKNPPLQNQSLATAARYIAAAHELL